MKGIVALTILATAACDTAPKAPAGAAPAAAAPCPLQIRFGSYAMGIDRGTLQRVEALLARDAAVTSVTRTPWGREGEITLCAALRRPADAERLAREIASFLPGDPTGPVAVRTASGLAFSAGR